MVNVIASHRVKDFDTWKPFFEDHEKYRKDNGELSYTLYRGIEDRNCVVIEFEWESLEKAKAFMGSEDLKKIMLEAGVLGVPDIRILETVTPKKVVSKAA